MRQSFWIRSYHERISWLSSKVGMGQKLGKFTYVFLDNGQGVCLKAIQTILHVNKNTLTKARQKSTNNIFATFPSMRGMHMQSIECISWLETYASMYGDRIPNSKDVLLPFKTLKKHVYEAYTVDMDEIVSEKTFFTIWKNHFPQLKIKKSSTFSQCSKCAILQRKFESSTCPETRLQLRKERAMHNQRQMLERKYYYAKRQAAKSNPDAFLSLIVDGMDQSKTDLPHFTGRQSKAINSAVLLKTHITGVISHGDGLFASFLDILQFPHDPNLTINVILKTLGKIAERKGFLPPVLYIQLDNCSRENKNKYVMAFCEALVRLNIFNEVHISFLYVGHTHEDIDAAFSKISEKLRKNDAETIPDIINLVSGMEKINYIWDVKKWLLPDMNKIVGISEPLHFKISRRGKNILVQFKGQQHTQWTVLGEEDRFLNGYLPIDQVLLNQTLIKSKKKRSAFQTNFEY